MPLKLSVGLSRKVGLPGYGSRGAACGVEVELDPGLLAGDPEAFHARARAAFDACARAVAEELDRRRGADRAPDVEDDHPCVPRARPATSSQVRALRAIAARLGLDLDGLVAGRHDVDGPEDLSVAEAGRLIDELQREPADATA